MDDDSKQTIADQLLNADSIIIDSVYLDDLNEVSIFGKYALITTEFK